MVTSHGTQPSARQVNPLASVRIVALRRVCRTSTQAVVQGSRARQHHDGRAVYLRSDCAFRRIAAAIAGHLEIQQTAKTAVHALKDLSMHPPRSEFPTGHDPSPIRHHHEHPATDRGARVTSRASVKLQNSEPGSPAPRRASVRCRPRTRFVSVEGTAPNRATWQIGRAKVPVHRADEFCERPQIVIGVNR